MTALIPVITAAGLRAVFRADSEGLQARISHIAVGDLAYQPNGSETALRREKQRIPIAGGQWVGDFAIHLNALLDGVSEFWIREIGIFLDDGTLLAVWSDPDTPLAYKTTGVPILLAFDLSLQALPPNAITVTAGDIDLTLFFGSEFAQMGAAIIGNANRNERLRNRVKALESDTRLEWAVSEINRLAAEVHRLRLKTASL